MPQFVQGRVLLPLFAALLLQVVASAQTPEKGSDAMAKIGTTIERIRAESSRAVRIELAWQLAHLISRQVGPDIGTVDVGVIDDIAALLGDNDDAIRYWAATALLKRLRPRAGGNPLARGDTGQGRARSTTSALLAGRSVDNPTILEGTGGSPTDPLNKIPLTLQQYSPATTWWNQLQRCLEGR